MGQMIALLDTNVIIRFLMGDKNEKYKDLRGFFESLENGKRHCELKLIVLFQVIFVLKSFYKVQKTDIAEAILNLLDYKGIIVKKKKNIRSAMKLWRDNKMEIVDCYLISCLAGDSQNIIYSYDRDFDKFDINRIEP